MDDDDYPSEAANFTQERMKRERANPPYKLRASSDEIIVKSIFGSVLYCLVILRTTPHWSVKMTSCYFKLLTWEQQIKITYAAWVRTTNKFQIIIIGHGDLLSYFILSCFTFKPINNNYFLLYLMSRVDPCPPISATVS